MLKDKNMSGLKFCGNYTFKILQEILPEYLYFSSTSNLGIKQNFIQVFKYFKQCFYTVIPQ